MVEYDYEQINKQELIWEDNNMSRLGMLYALNEEDVKKLRSVPEEERYEYVLFVMSIRKTFGLLFR